MLHPPKVSIQIPGSLSGGGEESGMVKGGEEELRVELFHSSDRTNHTVTDLVFGGQ